MSVKVLSRVLGNFHEDSDVGDRLVLVVLADAAHDDGITWIAQEDIAASARLSERHVRRCLKELEGRGEIEARKAQRSRRRINVYRVTCAPAQPDYDRLPFSLVEPFSTTGHDVRSSEGDDRTSDTGTTGHPMPESSVVPLIGPVSEPLEDLVARSANDPPKLTKIEGQDIAFNALAEECRVDLRGNRAREVGLALNGSIRHGLSYGIRSLAWQDLRESGRYAEAEGWERWLVDAIRDRARVYRETMSGATLTPMALAKWWTDLTERQRQNMKFGRRDVSSREFSDLADRLDERREIESGSG